MSIKNLRPLETVGSAERAALSKAMRGYYQNPPEEYYVLADKSPTSYSEDTQPFHCHLVSQITEGMTVLELGCGTAHLCPYVEQAGGFYHGVDYSDELLAANQSKFPQAHFYKVGDQPQRSYDIVVSLYTIEHVVDPVSYLQHLWSYVKPCGLAAVICPELVDGVGIPASVYFGRVALRIRKKLSRGMLMDAVRHLYELKILAPEWKRKARSKAPGEFWINTTPACLTGKPYTIDSDAIHLPRMKDIEWWFKQQGGDIMITSESMTDIPQYILNYNCYVLARKAT